MSYPGVQANYMVSTTNITTQPHGVSNKLLGPVEGHRDWESGLFGCFDDLKSCLCGFCCLWCAVMNISTRTGECCCMPCWVPGAVIALRARIRTLGGIRGTICTDCLTLSFCGACAVCQMQRELDNMGL